MNAVKRHVDSSVLKLETKIEQLEKQNSDLMTKTQFEQLRKQSGAELAKQNDMLAKQSSEMRKMLADLMKQNSEILDMLKASQHGPKLQQARASAKKKGP